jgi:hypothetical protein
MRSQKRRRIIVGSCQLVTSEQEDPSTSFLPHKAIRCLYYSTLYIALCYHADFTECPSFSSGGRQASRQAIGCQSRFRIDGVDAESSSVGTLVERARTALIPDPTCINSFACYSSSCFFKTKPPAFVCLSHANRFQVDEQQQ